MDGARPLNAFITETPDTRCRDGATLATRLARGEARPLEGMPLAIKDLFCTEAC